MAFPQLDFNGEEGRPSTSLGGPDAIEGDLRELANMFDPGSKLKNGQQGGIGSENLKHHIILPIHLSPEIINSPEGAVLYQAIQDLAALLNGKVDKVDGKGLSTNDYTNEDKDDVGKIDGLEQAVAELEDALDNIDFDVEHIFQTNVIESNTTITEVLYAEEGRIARLTVDHLLTGDFLSGDEYIYFIEAKDQYLKFIIGTRRDDLPMVQYTDWDENLLYWDSADHNYMTPNETEWPVMVYVYDLMTKLQMDFEPDDSGTMVPKIILGAGAGVAGFPDYGKAYIYKETDGLLLRYIKTDGTVLNLYLDEDGIHQTGSTGEQGIRNIHVAASEPVSPQTNDLWIDTDDDSVVNIWVGTADDYLDLTPSSDTLYFIKEEE